MANVPLLTNSADLSASQTSGVAAQLMPTGVILPFAGNTAPSGWLACNGAAVSRTTYAALFAALGGVSSPYGLGDGSTTFNLPDFRGRFPRFNDAMFGGSAAGRDTGRVHGSSQSDSTKRPTTALSGSTGGMSANTTHSHSPSAPSSAGLVQSGTSGAGANVSTGGGGYVLNSLTSVNLDHSHSFSISSGGDSETRPINLALNAIIKI